MRVRRDMIGRDLEDKAVAVMSTNIGPFLSLDHEKQSNLTFSDDIKLDCGDKAFLDIGINSERKNSKTEDNTTRFQHIKT